MHRRTFVSLAAVVPFAGCTGLLGGGGVDTTLEDDQRTEFDVSDGAELTVTVDVQEVFQPDTDIEREGVSFRLDHLENGVVDTRIVEDSETFDLEIEDGGTHAVMITGGIANVTIE
ncbi:hypothetical protein CHINAEXTREME_04250 [Halobiforma lacisalsi AJ5]|uniref:Uncharacterized protein n=1 Tax=Natronobacterium lacisalsi AJ5 TaxID=358396 RepID=M0LMG1_NATLA|nr:hypothetical protein [Halobiforma lacisalsi]APW97031.1 hypothetical protein CHINAEXTREME_04250 [Halobiforma lacisalsi AJ5]EMA34747.1 hypothetical protein C445_07495 [Halobiforma lacisalsi AJ5]